MSEKLLIYIHGFNSSPASDKAQAVIEYMDIQYPEVELQVPQLPPYPADAMAILEAIIAQYPGYELCFIGSSMGGYMATFLVNHFGGKAVLINPAVEPYKLFQDFIGPQHNPYTKQDYQLKPEHMGELIEIDTRSIAQPHNFWVLLQTGDEVLDFRLAQEKYRQSKLTIEQGGNHGFEGFERYLYDIVQFLKIA